MKNIAIVDDDQHIREMLQSYLTKYGEKYGERFKVTTFNVPEAFLTNYTAEYDIVFMDIDMPGMNGLQASKRLRELDENVILIFVTNLAQYAIKGYEVAATDFVVKPLEYEKFEVKMSRTLKLVADKKEKQTLLLRVESGVVSVNMDDVQFVEVQGHNVYYHTTKDVYRIRGTLKESAIELDSNDFFMCDKCYLVNLAHVDAVNGSEVLVGSKKINVSRSKKKAFMEALAAFYNKI